MASVLTVALALVATGVAQAKRRTSTQDSVVTADHTALAERSVRVEIGDIDSDMSALLAKSGVIREDTYNKPGDQYTLHVQKGGFKRYPLFHGAFEFAGAYGGALGGLSGGAAVGGLPGGLFGMFAGVPVGIKAGDKAAETLARIAQGQATIVKKTSPNSFVQDDMQLVDGQPTPKTKDQSAEDLKDAVQAIGGQKASGSKRDLRGLLQALSVMLESPDERTREDAKVTILMLEIARRGLHHNVRIVVE